MNSKLLLPLLFPLLFRGTARAASDLPSVSAVITATEEQDRQLAGVWQKSRGDAGATYVITLQLNADGTYTKELVTRMPGYGNPGGTHSGTWTSRGLIVSLSGDGHWPATSENLSEYRKVE